MYIHIFPRLKNVYIISHESALASTTGNAELKVTVNPGMETPNFPS